ncbi:MAG: hypothetical protein J1F42_02920 [Lachnospiraceae bacterium]|nr:hypothetical protein [Lachnospiraceae bacterium]
MSHYKLNVDFSDAALQSIYGAGMKLAIVKTVEGDKGSPVIWVSTLPFENNTIEWEEEYQLYASRQEAMHGATISKLSETAGITNLSFDFKDGIFQNAHSSDAVGENEYGLRNAMNAYSSLTFGLSEAVRVNGELQKGKPINAVSVLYNHQAVMSPIEKVQVFLANDINDGVVHTREFSNAIEVVYEDNDVEKSIRYDESKGIFVPV